MYELTIVTHFAAAHQLKMVARKCENLHGHNWKVEVCVAGDRLDPEAGILMDFGVLKQHVAEIIEGLDHRFLNETEAFGDACPPSSENIARLIATELDRRITDTPVRVARVRAWESETACATYIPG